ncbi:myb-like protein X isoform X2 [Diorhabda carinulata]|nr:myb-like protein X isoform X2 [Diorhabda carinulata]
MDVETELPIESDLNEARKNEDIKKPVDMEKSKERKSNVKPKRSSRSRTPQKKIEESKVLQIPLKKLDGELNGHEEKILKAIEEKQEDNKCEDEKVETIKELSETNGSVPEPNKTDSANNTLKEETDKQTENNVSGANEKAQENGKEELNEENIVKDKEVAENEESPKKNGKEELKTSERDSVEMEPLVVSDEVESELQFLEENSDKESGKGSPIIHRCATRRSYTRNIPTPKTPKLTEDPDSEKNYQTEENVCYLPNDIPKTGSNETEDSLDIANMSTAVEVGSDTTLVTFAEANDSIPPLDESYLQRLRERGLMARRPLRATEDYRTRVLRNAQSRSDLNFSYDSVEKVNTGIKRKSRSTTPEETKKFKSESPGYRNFFSSPITNLKKKFRPDERSSTPELLGYKDEKRNIHFNDDFDDHQIQETGDDEKKHWCSIM